MPCPRHRPFKIIINYIFQFSNRLVNIRWNWSFAKFLKIKHATIIPKLSIVYLHTESFFYITKFFGINIGLNLFPYLLKLMNLM